MKTIEIDAGTLEELWAALNKLRDDGVSLRGIRWWGWDLETIETEDRDGRSPYRFNPISHDEWLRSR